ncbi:chain-length determining protein [beta proteobacterium AAP121]|nr:chain-length determining protein [beta proteobacterium AAP65]KPF93206.1 chain-length determining protein [beta proteobacterium AAP121]
MTFGQFLAILRARWVVAVAVLAVTVLGTLAVNLLMPKQYKATASVVADFKPDPLSAVMLGGMQSPAFMATQVDIIKSDRVAQRVVRNLKLNENPQIRQQWQDETGGQGSIESWLGTVFQRQMEVLPSRESSVIEISYLAPDPRFAAALANAFVSAYTDTAIDLRVDPARRYSSFFEGRAKDAREALEAAQSRLSSFQREKGIVASDERLDVENARLNELSSQFTAVQAISAESGSRQAQAQSGQGDRMAEVLNNALVGGLKAELSRSEARLKELNTRLGDNHPAVQESRANIAELRQRLEAETRKVTSSVGVGNTINRQREGEIRRSLDAQRAKVLQLKQVRDEGMVLMREVDNAQRTYDAILQRLTQTSLEGQATQSNINPLSQADVPLYPASPRVVLNTAIATFAGLLLAVGVALVLELLDRRLRTVDDVATALDLPVIGVMPEPGAKLGLRRLQATLTQERLLAPLPSPGKSA